MRQRLVIGFFWLVCFIAVAVIGYAGLYILTQAQQTIAAIIAAIAGLLTTMLTQAFIRAGEQEAARVRALQERYAEILRNIGPFLRSGGAQSNADALAAEYLIACTVAAPQVVGCVNQFMKTRNSGSLGNLIRAMRKDLGLAERGLVFVPLDKVYNASQTGGLIQITDKEMV
ncbi:MAG: hypothetical protein ABSB42_04885 [Tepidisphaeraceae bacterium]|jgi:hypothetical protein